MTPVRRWCGRNPSIIDLFVFGGVSWDHIPNDFRKKLDAKSHVFIVMGYFEKSKSYQLFDPVK
jgi:hypothetical protein